MYFSFTTIQKEYLVTLTDYLIGIQIEIMLNVVGVFKLMGWLSDKGTKYVLNQGVYYGLTEKQTAIANNALP
jgi:hypothetical protein